MKKIKIYCKNNSSYQANFQRGNTLVPVIIGLAISAIATVAFLNQGANLSQKNKILMAQNEIARAIQQWNILKSTEAMSNSLTNSNFLGRPNVYGQKVDFNVIVIRPSNPTIANSLIFLGYPVNSQNTCNSLKSVFSSTMEGISPLGIRKDTDPNPNCILGSSGDPTLSLRLD